MTATLGAHRARTARSPRYAGRRRCPAGSRSRSRTVGAARSRLARSRPSGLRRAVRSLKMRVTAGEWRPRVQQAAIRSGGMAAATAWRSGAYGRAVPFPNPDRSVLPRGCPWR
ncbi:MULTISPECIES: hypothetical protein [unclassified Streptomyces]|uniref:hypothetical protein n=1 Tax=unclassified Streptomyces TaxID=2593676 RepID=UPI00093ABF28|nr:hypothetical protein [Streptomyces sp. TSRI0107]OKJ68429.1 hypothetical protein AMK31_37700 [Streptomyces sp. TSRI0107]